MIEYTTDEAPGAMPNGTIVTKVNSLPTDAHPDGTPALIIGSVGPVDLPDFPGVKYGYFVVWDDMPSVPVFIAGNRIEKVEGR